MGKHKKWWVGVVVALAVAAIGLAYLSTVSIPVLQPRGIIADKEFRLLITVTLVMCIVVVPVFILLAYIVWKYRDTNHTPKKYTPDVSGNHYLESLWWLIPTLIIVVLSVVTWNATYALNPFKPIPSSNKTIPVQVIALDWKWLFIYPTLNVASVNKVVFPVSTPVHFYLTSDAPMNSFWIPQLSGQIYTMPGMQTQLYIMASQKGDYKGWSANISGIGFASMMFTAEATTNNKFVSWVKQARLSSNHLTQAAYDKLAKPSSFVKPRYYSNPKPNLFNDEVMKYMSTNSTAMTGMNS